MKATTLETLSEIIQEICEDDIGQLQLDQNLLSDLGIDSLDLLDITYEIDRRFDITLPIDDWADQVGLDEKMVAEYFKLENVCLYIEHLVDEQQKLAA